MEKDEWIRENKPNKLSNNSLTMKQRLKGNWKSESSGKTQASFQASAAAGMSENIIFLQHYDYSSHFGFCCFVFSCFCCFCISDLEHVNYVNEAAQRQEGVGGKCGCVGGSHVKTVGGVVKLAAESVWTLACLSGEWGKAGGATVVALVLT